jgi:GH15 family glucan-1,4-alpha-glucosidase
VVRSLVTLKGLTYAPTGGIVAAATTSLPEKIGGVRNWDYRYCWLRDATFTLFALTRAGFVEEARSWRGWLLRAIAGSPAQMQILYGMHGERRLPEFEIEWLAGYENSGRCESATRPRINFNWTFMGSDEFALSRATGRHRNRREGLGDAKSADEIS